MCIGDTTQCNPSILSDSDSSKYIVVSVSDVYSPIYKRFTFVLNVYTMFGIFSNDGYKSSNDILCNESLDTRGCNNLMRESVGQSSVS